MFSQNIAQALDVAKQIDSGICHINGATVHDETQMPFGGTKASGSTGALAVRLRLQNLQIALDHHTNTAASLSNLALSLTLIFNKNA